MLYTLKVNSGAGKWLGYQILAGTGAGAGVQIPFIAVQVVLSDKDMPTGSTFTLNTLSILFNAALPPYPPPISSPYYSRKLSTVNDIPSLIMGSTNPPSRRCSIFLQLARRRHCHLHCPKHLRKLALPRHPQTRPRRKSQNRNRRRSNPHSRCRSRTMATWRTASLH
jgi:hypothetical protein